MLANEINVMLKNHCLKFPMKIFSYKIKILFFCD